jgi:dienelactone hydrolase
MSQRNRISAVIFVLSCVLGATAVASAPIAAGDGQQTVDIAGTRMTVFTYRPANCSDSSLLLVFHGVARNARSYRDYARPLADRNCLLLVAPLFAQRDFPGWRYQRGGIVKDGVVQNPSDWSGRLVPALVDWGRQQEGRPLAYSLLGHSAGGQFLERLAAFVPTQAKRIVVANPGSYVFPSLDVAAPYGLGKVYASVDGEADTRVDDRDDSPDARAQGASRYQRGVNAFNAARTLAQKRGWTFNWRLVELPGVGHNAPKMFSAPQASDALAP